MVPVMASGIGGQPEMLMTGLSVSSEMATAPVGLGFAPGMPPKVAQLPTAITALAFLAVSWNICRLVIPAIVE